MRKEVTNLSLFLPYTRCSLSLFRSYLYAIVTMNNIGPRPHAPGNRYPISSRRAASSETLEQDIITPQRHSAKDPALMPAEPWPVIVSSTNKSEINTKQCHLTRLPPTTWARRGVGVISKMTGKCKCAMIQLIPPASKRQFVFHESCLFGPYCAYVQARAQLP